MFLCHEIYLVLSKNFMHQLSKSHLCKNAKKKGLARFKEYALIVTKTLKTEIS